GVRIAQGDVVPLADGVPGDLIGVAARQQLGGDHIDIGNPVDDPGLDCGKLGGGALKGADGNVGLAAHQAVKGAQGFLVVQVQAGFRELAADVFEKGEEHAVLQNGQRGDGNGGLLPFAQNLRVFPQAQLVDQEGLTLLQEVPAQGGEGHPVAAAVEEVEAQALLQAAQGLAD